MSPFLLPLLGGVLIGLSASALLYFNGRTAGVSGIAAGLLGARPGPWGWRAAFLGGLVGGGFLVQRVMPGAFGDVPGSAALPLLAMAGLLVGFGTRMGNGCTSGHGVCGISRGSRRGIAATITFMVTGALSVFLLRTLTGGAA